MNRIFAALTIVIVGLSAGCATRNTTRTGAGKEWAIKADMSGACCCSIPCPCAFQQKPTLGHCDANVLFEIKSAHYKGTRLDGLKLVMTWQGGSWVKYYLSDKASDRQLAAIQKLMPEAVPIFKKTKVMAAERVPITIRRSGGKIAVSVPDSKLEITLVKGKDGGPILTTNLNHPLTENRIQYLASTLIHEDSKDGFSHTGTSGMTSVMDKASAR